MSSEPATRPDPDEETFGAEAAPETPAQGSAPGTAAPADPLIAPPGPPPRRKPRLGRWLRWLVWILFAAGIGYYSLICYRVYRQARIDEARPADVIVVFGAAEYSGHPSPIFRARLEHALKLYGRGLAPYLIITGGSGRDPQFSEGGVGRDFLAAHGIGDRYLIAETQGENTVVSAERVAVIMRANQMRSCIAVSDPFHLYRIKKLMERQGITTYVSPRPYAFRHPWLNVLRVMREAFSYLVSRLM
jgi:uncharacterized SAM-binding protein YcdF (DUF218 family)